LWVLLSAELGLKNAAFGRYWRHPPATEKSQQQRRMSFAQLGLSEPVLKAVAEAGYVEPTPIQAQAIPVILTGRDVLGSAQTGTGKTAGFTLPMIDILSAGRAKARMPRSLILEPTRELAAQVAESFETYGKHTKLTKALIIGGESMSDQERALDRGVDVLIATPGRLLDLFERGKILLRDIKVLVIDEADRMLDMGFIPDIERIVTLLPPLRQTLFFSATMPPEIRRLADKFLSSPKEITVARPATTAQNIEDFMVPVTRGEDKRSTLRALLRSEPVKTALIFCNRKRDVDILYKSLTRHGFQAGALHGDMAQDRRTSTLERFRLGEIPILVASDVAARGLDIDDITHVFNFDVPYNAEDYVHRIGRTGRAGRSGRAFTLMTPDDGRNVGAIERLIRRSIARHNVDLPEGEPHEGGPPERRHAERGHRRPRGPDRHARAQPEREEPRGERRDGRQHEKREEAGRRQEPQRQDRPKQEKPRHEKPQHAPRPPSQHAPKPQSHQRPARQHDRVESDKPTGFGDNVPAFLKRR
jgi:superfamily II DNA/RNA helicase